MRAPLFQKTLRDDRRALAWWSAGLAAAAALYISIYPSVRASSAQMTQYLDRLPQALRNLFIGEKSLDLSSVNGYLKMEVFSLMFPLLLIVFAIGAGARTIAGEEQRGTLEVLLANPVKRSRIVAQKELALIASTTGLASVFIGALLVGTAPLKGDIGYANILAAAIGALMLGVAFGALALAVGAVRGRRGSAIGIASGAAVAMYLVNALGPSVSWLGPARRASLFYYYWAADPLVNGINVAHLLILAAFAAICLILASVAFEHRDVGLT